VLGGIPGFPLNRKRVAALVNRAAFPTARIERDLGYRHVVTLEHGLRELVLAWRAQR
jgi:hypothetical protein